MTNANRQITFAARPTTWVGEEHFALQTNTIPTPGNGEMLVRNLYMSVDPYMRGMMNTGPSYAAALEIGDVLLSTAGAGVILVFRLRFFRFL